MFDKLSKQFAAFVVIGAIGFIIDGGVLTYLSTVIGVNVYISRLISFAIASFATWILNRKYTFRTQNSSTAFSLRYEYSRYMIIQSVGALINLGIFISLIMIYPTLKDIPIIPLAIGSGIALIFNFGGGKMWVFRMRWMQMVRGIKYPKNYNAREWLLATTTVIYAWWVGKVDIILGYFIYAAEQLDQHTYDAKRQSRVLYC